MQTARNAEVIREAAVAIRAGDKLAARRLLDRHLAEDPQDETAWLWRAAVAEGREDAIYALERVLQLNPGNQQARQTLEGYYGQPAAAVEAARAAEAAQSRGPESREQTISGRNGFVVPDRPASPPGAGGARPAAAPAASTNPPPARGWRCPICQVSAPEAHKECPACHAFLDLSDLNRLREHRPRDERAIVAGMQRAFAQLKRQHSVETYYAIVLGYLNLQASQEALPYLEILAKHLPGDGRLATALRTLQARPLVMAVDDSPTIRKILSVTLERASFRVALAATGPEALAKLESLAPDLVLLDITMPGLDGYHVCREIRAQEKFKQTPVVMLSGKDGFFDKVKGKMAGATSYLTKPFEPSVLVETIHSILKQQVSR